MQIWLASARKPVASPRGARSHLAIPCHMSQNCVKVQWSVRWCPRCRNGLPFILADLSSFSNTLKRCRKEKKESSVFSQRTEEASAVQYFQVRKCCPPGGKESFPGDAHLQTHLWTHLGRLEGREEVMGVALALPTMRFPQQQPRQQPLGCCHFSRCQDLGTSGRISLSISLSPGE